METPWGAAVTFAFLWTGLLLFLALVSYTPNDLPSGVPISTTSEPNDPAHNFMGVLGAIIAGYSYVLLGAASYLVAVACVWLGLSRFVAKILINQRTVGGLALFVLTGASLAHLQPFLFKNWDVTYNIQGAGGAFGAFFGGAIRRLIGGFGAQLILLSTYLLGLVLLTGFPPVTFYNRCVTGGKAAYEQWKQRRWEAADELEKVDIEKRALSKEIKIEEKRKRRASKKKEEVEEVEEVEQEVEQEQVEEVAAAEEAEEPEEIEEESVEEVAVVAEAEPPPKPKIIIGSARRPKHQGASADDGTLPVRSSFQGVSFENYKLPPLDLLHFEEEEEETEATEEKKRLDEGFLLRNQNTIVETLSTFGLEVYPGDITRGPAITRYEIYPSKGLRVSRIVTLEPDIARATKAERINIIAPIPGKDTVGIEIANKDKIPVPLRELLDDPSFRKTNYKIPLALGKDVYGNPVLADLAQMPHLLVAGATGSGKSVCINSIVASLLFQFSPEQLRFIMIDPKVVEMQIYNDLPHLVVPVVTDPKKVILALRWVVKEMERRYQLFAKVGKRNFDSFNARDRSEPTRAQKEAARTSNRATASNKRAATVVDEDTGILPGFDTDTEGAKTEEEDEILTAVEAEDIAETTEVIEESAAVATVGVGSEEDEEEENPPFFVHPVSIKPDESTDDADDDPLASAFEGDAVPWEGDEIDEEEEDTLPPHEFATPPASESEIPDSLPYIVVIIDELADLMQTAPADVELAIARITQMARAAGIHLIVATQTPRADVITGVIKANIPCRIAFQVSSGIDSRVILDAKGADRLVGKGDMLYLPPGSSQLVRSQGALVSDEEIQDLVDHCRDQGEPVYEQEIQATLDGKTGGESNVSDEDEEILTKCMEVIRQEKRASTSLMQRRLGLGYTRAARMMDILEERGYVGPGEGAKPREILVDFEAEFS